MIKEIFLDQAVRVVFVGKEIEEAVLTYGKDQDS